VFLQHPTIKNFKLNKNRDSLHETGFNVKLELGIFEGHDFNLTLTLSVFYPFIGLELRVDHQRPPVAHHAINRVILTHRV
ncbi:MAG: hypothetical protein ACK56F_11090, partial [bacterium]